MRSKKGDLMKLKSNYLKLAWIIIGVVFLVFVIIFTIFISSNGYSLNFDTELNTSEIGFTTFAITVFISFLTPMLSLVGYLLILKNIQDQNRAIFHSEWKEEFDILLESFSNRINDEYILLKPKSLTNSPSGRLLTRKFCKGNLIDFVKLVDFLKSELPFNIRGYNGGTISNEEQIVHYYYGDFKSNKDKLFSANELFSDLFDHLYGSNTAPKNKRIYLIKVSKLLSLKLYDYFYTYSNVIQKYSLKKDLKVAVSDHGIK